MFFATVDWERRFYFSSLETRKCDSLPALMYSPPALRTREAIFAKFSDPKYWRGLITIYFSVSSNVSMFSSSLGNIVRMSATDRIRAVGVGAAGAIVAGAGVGAPVVFRCFEISDRSSEISFNTTRS